MSEKMTCPVCNSHSSSVLRAVLDGDPCPNCGASADVILEVERLREQRADDQLKRRVEELLVELDKVTTERNRLARKVEAIRWALDDEQ